MPRAGDDHETRRRRLPAKLDRLLSTPPCSAACAPSRKSSPYGARRSGAKSRNA
ncbi:MAG: hypothetical protein MZV63_15095 [Marinilabiliales bacterium]|nr:hypothetical protein [Marinilabiliales bacterium]